MTDKELGKLMEEIKTCVLWQGKNDATNILYNRIKNSGIVDERVHRIFEVFKDELDEENIKILARTREEVGY